MNIKEYIKQYGVVTIVTFLLILGMTINVILRIT